MTPLIKRWPRQLHSKQGCLLRGSDRGLTEEGRDVFARWVVGWSIADHQRAELMVDALPMAICGRRPLRGRSIVHSVRGSNYTSSAFDRRLHGNGLLGSMGTVGD